MCVSCLCLPVVLGCSSPSKLRAWSSVWRALAWSTGAKCPRPHHLLGSFHLCWTLSLVLWDDGRNWATCPMTKPLPYHRYHFLLSLPFGLFCNHCSEYFCPFPWVFPSIMGSLRGQGLPPMLWPHTCPIRQVVSEVLEGNDWGCQGGSQGLAKAWLTRATASINEPNIIARF